MTLISSDSVETMMKIPGISFTIACQQIHEMYNRQSNYFQVTLFTITDTRLYLAQ